MNLPQVYMWKLKLSAGAVSALLVTFLEGSPWASLSLSLTKEVAKNYYAGKVVVMEKMIRSEDKIIYI